MQAVGGAGAPTLQAPTVPLRHPAENSTADCPKKTPDKGVTKRHEPPFIVMEISVHLRPGAVDDEASLLHLFDEAVRWLTQLGLRGRADRRQAF
jgi:hypothetical protein